LIAREVLEQFGDTQEPQRGKKSKPRNGSKSNTTAFDLDAYIAHHGLKVKQIKAWPSQPDGFIYELEVCLFNPAHTQGAAFTLVNGRPGFRCHHNGCAGKTIHEVFEMYPDLAPPGESESSQTQVLLGLCEGMEFFHTSDEETYACVPLNGYRQTMKIRGSGFAGWLTRAFYRSIGKPPGAKALQETVAVLDAKAKFDFGEKAVHVRVAEHDGRIYVDLCDKTGAAVEISGDGWRFLTDAPVQFIRHRGLKPLDHPEAGGSISLLRKFINIGDDENWILCLSWLVASLRPTGPYPVLIVQGPQGSAKTTLVRILRLLTDPSVAPVKTPPASDRDLVISAANSHVIAYDNMSGTPPWLSDALCRLATGGGFSTRALYTDRDEVFFDAVRPVILNGIDHLAERPDLAERSLVLSLPGIDGSVRRDERTLFSEFVIVLPKILGALFTAVSCALRRLPDVKLEFRPRMADFADWAAAAAPALGFTEAEFLAAYRNNRADAVQETLEGDLVASAITALMEEIADTDAYDVWQGTCKDLLARLGKCAGEDARKATKWPKTPRGLSGSLRRLTTFLREVGIEVTFAPRGGKGKRPLTVRRISSQSTVTSASTATQTGMMQPYQLVRQTGEGGVVRPELADQPPPGTEPPLEPPAANPLKRNEDASSPADVAEVAVGCEIVREEQRNMFGADDRIDLCGRCGSVDWEWRRGAWVCPKCGNPARGRQPRERIEI